MPLFGANVEKLKADRDLEGLVKALRRGRTRDAAMAAIRELDDPSVIPHLVAEENRFLKGEDTRAAVKKALQHFGPRAVGPLREELGRRGSRARSAGRLLAALGDERALEPLLAGLRDDRSDTRGAAAASLPMLADPGRAVDALIAALDDSDKEVVAEVCESLGEIGDPRAVDPLIRHIGRDYPVGKKAIGALDKIGDQRATDALLGLMERESADVDNRTWASIALSKLEDPEVAAAVQRFRKAHPPRDYSE
jgi:HEAT repeat protein